MNMNLYKSKGFSLLEILVASVIVIAVISGIFSSFVFFRDKCTSLYLSSEAINYARAIMEEQLIADYFSLADYFPAVQLPAGDFRDKFNGQVTKTVGVLNEPGTSPPVEMAKQITITVSWREPSGGRSHSRRFIALYAKPN
jgi:type II secretory pathway pseudopilin PulG